MRFVLGLQEFSQNFIAVRNRVAIDALGYVQYQTANALPARGIQALGDIFAYTGVGFYVLLVLRQWVMRETSVCRTSNNKDTRAYFLFTALLVCPKALFMTHSPNETESHYLVGMVHLLFSLRFQSFTSPR